MWNPEQEPYRVLWAVQTSAPGCYGWRHDSRTFPTEQQARDAMNKPFGPGVTSATVQIAVNAATWAKNGKWKQIAKRKRAR